MKSWNAHAWYCVGILLALLIGMISVEWNTIPRLPEIISFAVGLSSLILAIFAIIQSITAGGDATATLAAVREAASDLKETSGTITGTLRDVQSTTGSVLQSSEANRVAIEQLKEEVAAKAKSDSIAETPVDAQQDRWQFAYITFGGGAATYAAIRSFQTSKRFSFREIFSEDSNVSYEQGFLGALRSLGLLDYSTEGKYYTTTKLEGNPQVIIDRLKSVEVPESTSLGTYESRLAKVDAYFDKAA